MRKVDRLQYDNDALRKRVEKLQARLDVLDPPPTPVGELLQAAMRDAITSGHYNKLEALSATWATIGARVGVTNAISTHRR